MARRKKWYVGELVTEGKMDDADDNFEEADQALVVDQGAWGVYSGFTVSQKSGTPNLSVDVTAGLAYTPLGERVSTAGAVNVDCAFDYLGGATAVLGAGNSKILSVFLLFDRLPSVPETDANSAVVYTILDESYSFEVVQGAEALSPSAPALRPDAVLLADVTITFGQTQIVNANISTSRRQDQIVLTGSPFAGRWGTNKAFFQAMVSRYNDHVLGNADAHGGSGVTYGGSSPTAFADATTLTAGTLEVVLDTLTGFIGATTGGASGAHKLGSASIVGTSTTIPAGTTYSQLVALKSAANLEVAALTAWRGGRTFPATSGQAAFQKLIDDLGAQDASDDGAERIGAESRTGAVDILPAGSVASQTSGLLNLVGARARIASVENITGAWTVPANWSVSGAWTVGGAWTVNGAWTFNALTTVANLLQALRLGFPGVNVGSITANTTLAAGYGYYFFVATSNSTSRNIAIPNHSGSGNPIIIVRGNGMPTNGIIYFVNPADLSTPNPTDGYGSWGAAAANGSLNEYVTFIFQWNGTFWRTLFAYASGPGTISQSGFGIYTGF